MLLKTPQNKKQKNPQNLKRALQAAENDPKWKKGRLRRNEEQRKEIYTQIK